MPRRWAMSSARIPSGWALRTLAARRSRAPRSGPSRALRARGSPPGEAANPTAYLAGIEVGAGRPWRLADIDRLLFLRELCRTGRLGADDGFVHAPLTAGGVPARAPAHP